MLLAAIDDTPYNILKIVHIATAMVALAAAFAHPALTSQAMSLQAEARAQMMGFLLGASRRMYAPALLVSGLIGFGLAGMSKIPGTDQLTYEMKDPWLILAFVVWVAMNGLLHGLQIPAERAMSQGEDEAAGRVRIAGAANSVLLVVMLWLMVFKPF